MPARHDGETRGGHGVKAATLYGTKCGSGAAIRLVLFRLSLADVQMSWV